eukprot:TRINITY_DN18549_c0_g1_i1.p1 TRINITY_DN18549_c0_g1~~TRINITY_DN18549_c0_g1_i1.p1  ORF type:complete len:317 (+),score=39.13 TRINITY_DN18549_c0_g1_i1:61-951(+)
MSAQVTSDALDTAKAPNDSLLPGLQAEAAPELKNDPKKGNEICVAEVIILAENEPKKGNEICVAEAEGSSRSVSTSPQCLPRPACEISAPPGLTLEPVEAQAECRGPSARHPAKARLPRRRVSTRNSAKGASSKKQVPSAKVCTATASSDTATAEARSSRRGNAARGAAKSASSKKPVAVAPESAPTAAHNRELAQAVAEILAAEYEAATSETLKGEDEDGSAISSVGALGHEAGTCSPCAWFWRPSGCSNGRDCRFCHTCPNGTLRRKRREKTKLMRIAEAYNLKVSEDGQRLCL